jgi:hypothetical protein
MHTSPALFEGKRAVDYFAAQLKKILSVKKQKAKCSAPFGYIYFSTFIRPTDKYERYYVGQSTKFQNLGTYFGSGRIVAQLLDKYGEASAHVTPIIRANSREELDYIECVAVALAKMLFANSCINIRGGGGGNGQHSDKTKKLMSRLKSGRTTYNDGIKTFWLYPDDPKTKVLNVGSIPRAPYTEAYKENMSKVKKGNVKHSLHTRRLLSQATSRLVWFNDGTRNYRLAPDNPERLTLSPGILPRGPLSAKTKRKIAKSSGNRDWYNDGVRSFRLKGDDPRIEKLNDGRLPHDKLWYNDGTSNYMLLASDARTLLLVRGKLTHKQTDR